jgi:Zn-finger nucleic acid-binding protein
MRLPARGDVDADTSRRCPRCLETPAALATHLVGETLLDECNACGGVWIDAAAFAHLVKHRDEQAVLSVARGPYVTLEAFGTSSLDVEAPRYLPCPDCSQLMNRQNFATTSGVIVDICRPHGIWFDRDELGRIVRFVMQGGLETARRRELEGLEQKLKQKRQELAGLASPSAITPGDTWPLDLLRVLRAFLS